jgi:cell division protein FtsW (lipid II flippase)
MTIFYYPTLLGFVASTLAFVFNPDLADNGVYTGIVIVVVFWSGCSCRHAVAPAGSPSSRRAAC